MPQLPPCRRLGAQCRGLSLTVRIADLKDDTPALQDAAATWMLGHTERISFSRPYVLDGELLVDAAVRVGCKYLVAEPGNGDGRQEVRCSAHGFRGTLPPETPVDRAQLLNGGGRFTVVQGRKLQAIALPRKPEPRRSLPTLQPNPCAGAPCRTADNTRGAACCRDLTLDVATSPRDRKTELLLRSRRSPYLCKVKRTDERTIECEVISACGYLDPADGYSCTLHGRLRPDGNPAKPSICSDWPDFDDEEFTGHPGCRLL